ncbi:MAG: ATP-binding protein [Chloroflexota bacterium]
MIEQTPRQCVVDMEASIEHMSRGTVQHVDVLLVVVEPYFRSLETAGRLAPLARDLGIRRVYAIANKVRDADDLAAVEDYCQRHDLELLASVPFDEAIVGADRAGVAVLDFAPKSPAVMTINRLASVMEEAV